MERWIGWVCVGLAAGCSYQTAHVDETRAKPATQTSEMTPSQASTPAPGEGDKNAAATGGQDPVALTDDRFAQQVLDSQKPVLVDCWAPWCGPCRQMNPIVEEVAAEFRGRVVVAKLNIDDNEKTPARYEIDAIPAFLFFKNGQLVKKLVGSCDKAELVDALNTMLQP